MVLEWPLAGVHVRQKYTDCGSMNAHHEVDESYRDLFGDWRSNEAYVVNESEGRTPTLFARRRWKRWLVG
jgi:hypothetical protein